MIRGESFGSKTGAVAIAAGLALYLSGDSSSPVRNSGISGACYEPTAEEISTVHELMSHPPARLPSESGRYDPGGDHASEIAHRHGLTVPDSTLSRQAEMEYAQSAPFETIFGTVKKYLGTYGITLSIAKENELSPGSSQVPTSTELHSKTSRYETMEVAEAFGAGMPLEYARFSGIRRIVLAAHTGDAAYALTAGHHDTVAVDVTASDPDPLLVAHETYHQIDAAECDGPSGMFNDPGFISLNGSDIYEHGSEAITLLSPKVTRLQETLIDEQQQSNKKACDDQKDYEDLLHQVVASDPYSLTNQVEDKAEIGKFFAFPSSISTEYNPVTPTLRSKFTYLLARLYHFRPNIVRYIADAGTRPYTEQVSIIKNCP